MGRGMYGEKNIRPPCAPGSYGAEVEALAGRLDAEGGGTSAETEEALREALRQEGARFLREHYEARLSERLGLGRIAGSQGKRTRTILTSQGEIEIRRLYVPGRGCPLDAAIGLSGGCTPLAAEMICHAAAMDESYAKGEVSLRRLAGLAVPDRRLQRLVNRVSPEMEAAGADRKPDQLRPGQRTDSQLDMTGVPARPEDLAGTPGQDGEPRKKQLKVGVSFRREQGSDGQWRTIRSSLAHLVAWESPEKFGERMREWMLSRGLGAADVHTVTADGAPWIWELVRTWFPGAREIVDFYHAAEHLHELCRLAHPKDEAAADALFEVRRRILRTYGARSLVRHFETLAAKSPAGKEILAKLDYFRTNLARMEYGAFRREGLVIGSGAVEGSCRSLVNQRADLSGQRWHPQGALNVLRIRGMVIDDIHAHYWRNRGQPIPPPSA